MKFGKITIIGAGRVGTSTAFALICQNSAKEITLLDINEDVLDAESIDLRDAKYFSYTGHVHKGSWEDAKNSQIIVICAGEVLRPESSLHQVVTANKKCLDDIFGKLGTLDSKCVVVMATSPVDAMTQYAQKLSGLPKNQVFGTGTLLDTQRLRVKLGKKFKINEKSVHAYVMGEKGDTAFVPWSHATVAGRKLTDFFSEDRESQTQILDTFVDKIKTKTDRMLWSKYGTNFGIAACIAAICKDIIYDCNSVLPLSCWVNDFGCYMSVLCTLGENGITTTLPLDLTDKEKRCFWNCSHSIWNTLKILGFQKEGFGAVGEEKEWQKEGWGIGEKKGVTEGMAPGGGLGTDLSGTGSQMDIGKGPEIGGGLGTDLGGFGKTSFEPLQPDLEGGLLLKQTEGLKQTEIGTKPSEFGTALSSTDIRGIDLGKKSDVGTTNLGLGTDLSGRKPESLGTTETTGLGRDLGKTTGFGSTGTTTLGGLDRGDISGTDLSGKKTESDVTGGTITELAHRPDIGATDVGGAELGGGLGTPTDIGTMSATDIGLGKEKLGDTTKTPDTSFGGGPGISSDVKEGLQKDIGGGELEKKKPLVTDAEEGRVDESVGRPIRQ